MTHRAVHLEDAGESVADEIINTWNSKLGPLTDGQQGDEILDVS